jgi:hypothetical protein
MTQRKELHRALLSAFKGEGKLDTALSLQMDLSLDDLTTPAPWPHRLAKLIEALEERGRLLEFIEMAIQESQESGGSNPALSAYAEKFKGRLEPPGRATFELPSNPAQLLPLMQFALPWFAVLTFSALAVAIDPSRTMLLSTMGVLLVLGVASVWRLSAPRG